MASITEVECGVVYLLTCVVSGKQYVGQTWEYEKRLNKYRLGRCRGQRALYCAIKKYGWGNFTAVKIVQGIQTQEWLDKIETGYIKAFNTMSPYGYNLMSGGKGGKHSAESKAKIGNAHRGRSLSAEHRAKLRAANIGKPLSDETRKKMSVSQRKRQQTPPTAEARANMSASAIAAHARKRAASSNTMSLL